MTNLPRWGWIINHLDFEMARQVSNIFTVRNGLEKYKQYKLRLDAEENAEGSNHHRPYRP